MKKITKGILIGFVSLGVIGALVPDENTEELTSNTPITTETSNAFENLIDTETSITTEIPIDPETSITTETPTDMEEPKATEEPKSIKEQVVTEKQTVAKVPETTKEEIVAEEPVAPNAQLGNNDNFNTYDNELQQKTEATYVLNTNSMKIHHPSCNSVKKIAPQNYATSNNSIDELISQGYSTCGNCF